MTDLIQSILLIILALQVLKLSLEIKKNKRLKNEQPKPRRF